MKKFLFIAIVLTAVLSTANAQEEENFNQYGQKINSTIPLKTTAQDGVLVMQNKEANYKMWFDVRIQTDAATFFGENKDFDPIGDGMSLRRARFAVKAQINKNWYGEFDTDWANGMVEIKDAYMAYSGIPKTEISIGNFKESFSIQRNTTSRYLMFMERPMVTYLAPSRHLGANLTYANKWFWLAAGAFGPELKGAEEGDMMQTYNKEKGYNVGLSYTGKLVLRPLYKMENASLHLGVAYSYRNPKTSSTDGYPATRFSARNTTDINRRKYIDTGTIADLDHEELYTFEIAGHWNGLRYEAAYIQRTAILDKDLTATKTIKNNQTANGWYAQAGYLLFGARQNYDADGAKYTRINRGNKKFGDLELCARYEYANFNTGDYYGGSGNIIALGLNYYPNENVKIVINYQMVNNDQYANGKNSFICGYDSNGNPTTKFENVNVSKGQVGADYQMLAMRFQIAF